MGLSGLPSQRQQIPATSSAFERGTSSNRWMVWAPDRKEPERETVGHCVPLLEQMDYAIRLGLALNKHANEGGGWMVAWTDPDHRGVPTRLAMGWVDPDGDMPFTVDCEDGIETLNKAGVEPLLCQAHAALMEYREHLKATEVSAKQMIRQRAGEPMRDPTQIVPADFG